MEPRDSGLAWLEQAEEDLRWAQYIADAGGYYLACFLSQQVGEKALKAFLFHQGEELIFSHSVEELCQSASAYNADIREHCRDWGYLDNFYTSTRYPNALPGSIPARVFGETAARQTIALATEVVNFVGKQIKPP